MLSLIAFCAVLYLLAWTWQIVRLLRALGLATEIRTAPETDP